jgi:hypothetical protein
MSWLGWPAGGCRRSYGRNNIVVIDTSFIYVIKIKDENL